MGHLRSVSECSDAGEALEAQLMLPIARNCTVSHGAALSPFAMASSVHSASSASFAPRSAPRVGPVTHSGTPSLLASTPGGISWQPIAGCRWPSSSWKGWSDGAAVDHMPYEEILSAKYLPTRRCSCALPPLMKRRHHFEVYGIRRSQSDHSTWRVRTVAMSTADADQAKAWVRHINDAVVTLKHRPRRLLVFVNPFGGAKRAMHVWKAVAAPVLQMARVQCDVVETVSAGHAKSTIAALQPEQLQRLSGIVAVGGDGLFQELVGGVMALKTAGGEAAAAAMALRLGHVPAGSTDAVAYTLNGSRDALTAALHIALGDSTPLDMARVDSGDGAHRYCVCMASYGFMGDIMATSEELRWMGPVRYDVAGVFKYLQFKHYEATIWYKPAPEAPKQPPGSCKDAAAQPQQCGCYRACSVCLAAAGAATADAAMAALMASPGCVDGAGAYGSTKDVAAAPVLGTPPWEGWLCRKGRFISVMCVVTSCRSDRSHKGVAPAAHLADGRVTLVMVSDCSRVQYLQFLLLLAQKGVYEGMMPFVEVVQATAVQVEPDSEAKQSTWNVDGETLTDNRIRMHVHHAALNVFARGVERPPDGAALATAL